MAFISRAAVGRPCASSRCWNCGEGGPQKICLATRRTYIAVKNVPATAGKSHQRWPERQVPRKVSSSATKPAVAGRPSEDRLPIVNAVAMPGIAFPNPPILPISREWAFS